MGIYNRDYYRESPPRGTGGGYSVSGSPNRGIITIAIINAVVFLMQKSIGYGGPGREAVTNALSLNLYDLHTFQVWRLITYGFCHADFSHIFFNMFILWMFGRMVEPIYGTKEFVTFYLTSIVVSGLCHLAVQAVTSDPTGVIGASGGVMAVVFLTAMKYPRMTVLVMFVFPMQLRWLAVLYAFADVTGMFNAGSNVAHAAHLGGAAFGVAYAWFGWNLTSMFEGRAPRVSMPRRRPSDIKIYEPEQPADLDAEVDRILEKISREGEESLTKKERETMITASRRARGRRGE